MLVLMSANTANTLDEAINAELYRDPTNPVELNSSKASVLMQGGVVLVDVTVDVTVLVVVCVDVDDVVVKVDVTVVVVVVVGGGSTQTVRLQIPSVPLSRVQCEPSLSGGPP